MSRSAINRALFDIKTRVMMPHARAGYSRLVAAERAEPAGLHRSGRERTMALARYAFERTEFYREHYSRAGFSRADLVPQNLEALPLLTKQHVRDSGSAMRVSGMAADRFLASVTGGSTGSPLVVYHDARAPHAAMWWRLYRWWGIDPGDDAALIYRRKHSGSAAIKEYLTWWPTRHPLLDARDMDTDAVDAFVEQCRRVRPQLIIGYVEGVAAFARRVRELDLNYPAPRAISVTASALHPGQRELLQQVLGAPVYDTYRTAEVPWVAAECQHRRGLHVQADIRHVEIIDRRGDIANEGEDGDVLLTDLTNNVFPLIRYAVGDRSSLAPGPCRCGRTLPRLEAIKGRIADVLHTPSGREVTGGLSAIFNRWPTAVQQFQIHQSADYRVELRYVPGHQADSRAVEHARQSLARMLHHEVPVRAVAVPTIVHQGGKARLVHSEAARA
ncbi:MAG: phenylacetate--CoA ligase family protein [Beutenbergiaceae bacterium]